MSILIPKKKFSSSLLHKYGFEDFEEAPPNGAEQKAITRFGISSMNKKNLEVIFSKPLYLLVGPPGLEPGTKGL